MPYLFTCPHCQAQTMVSDQYSGQAGECMTCGRPIQVPAFATGGAIQTARNNAGLRLAIGAAIGTLVVLAIAVVAYRYGGQGVNSIMTNRTRGQCMQNAEKIAKALNAYARDYGTYPPPTTFAADGKTAMHSWRVLILPYLGYQNLYNKYDMSLSWDSTVNQAIVFEMPNEYRSPASVIVSGVEPNYFLITGPGTLFPSSGPLGQADILDGLSKTLLLVEAESGPLTTTQWTEPGDFDITTMSLTIGMDMGGSHDGGTTAATADAIGHFLQENLDPSVLKALISPAGGEGLSDDVLD